MENKKKKLIVILLLLFAVIGVAGYGVYSYYYTFGEMETEEADSEYDDNVISITDVFKPWVSQDSGMSDFLGKGGTIDLSCPGNISRNQKITCEATVHVENKGTTPISVSYSDVYANASSNDVSTSVVSRSLSWASPDYYDSSTTTISANSSTELYIEVEVNVGDGEYSSSDEAQFVTAPVASGSLSAYVGFRLDATQNHD